MANKKIRLCELAIYYDEECIEAHEYNDLEELSNELKDVLVYFKQYTKIEISIITKDEYGGDNINSELLFTITNNRENKGE